MKKFFLFAAAVIALAACNNDDNYIDDPIEAQITAEIGEKSLTRANGSSWDNGDEIGVTMVGRYSNIKYTTESGDGIFAGKTMYFKNKREPVTLSAYYPYTGDEGTVPAGFQVTTEAERQTAAEQQKFDFLYAVKENVTGSEPNVSFAFSHMMSKITFIFKNGNTGVDVKKLKNYEVNGLILEGTFNPATGYCTANNSTSPAPLSVVPTVNNEEVSSTLIVFPQTVSTVTLKITDGEDQEYGCDLKFNDNRLEAGNNYLYTIKVTKTGLKVENYAITDWTEKPDESEAKSE